MTRQPIVAANWKMHKTHLEAIRDVQKLSYLLAKEDAERVEVVICPAFTALRPVGTLIEGDRLPYRLGAQTVHHEERGAFTGEVSPEMLAALKVQYVIIGHSERRSLFGETDEIVNRKVKAVVAHGMTPIVCVGETLDQREAGGTDDRVAQQVRKALAGLDAATVASAVVAYEPIWAIGTGKSATPEIAQEAHAWIREQLRASGGDAADAVRILYGGSVKPDNAAELLAQPDIDGALVGGASLEAASLLAIAAAAQ